MRRVLSLLPFLLLVALADPPPPPQANIDQAVRDFITGILGAMLNLNDWLALFKAAMRDFQSGAYTIGRSLIVVGLIWSLIRAVYYGSLEEVLAAMARVVLAGGFLWFGEVVEEKFSGPDGVYKAVADAFRVELADQMTEASNNLKALGAVINPLFTIVALVEAGVVHLAGTSLQDASNTPGWVQNLLSGIGAAAQLLNPASLLLIPFVIIAMVLTVVIDTMFLLAGAFWPIVAGSIALPIGLGASLFGRWVSVVVWAFIMGAVGPYIVSAGLQLGVSRPAAYIASQSRQIVNTFVSNITNQYRENRRAFAENLDRLRQRHNWNPEVCGYQVFVDADGKLNYRNVDPDPNAILSPRACGTMLLEAQKLTMAQVGTTVLAIGKGLVDMFQAWAQTLFMTMGGMAAALLIAGYVSTLLSSFFGGLSLAATAAAIGYATSMGSRAMGGMAQGAMASAEVGGAAAAGMAGAAVGAVERLGGMAQAARQGLAARSVGAGGVEGAPPAYERLDATPWMHRAGYGEGVGPVVVQREARSYPVPAGSVEMGEYHGAPVAPGRWTERGAYERPSGQTVEGPEPPGRWSARGPTWIRGGEE